MSFIEGMIKQTVVYPYCEIACIIKKEQIMNMQDLNEPQGNYYE